MKNVTIKKLSQITGVSSSTISRVLTSSGYVKDETRQIVEKAIQENGYTYRGPTESSLRKKIRPVSNLVFVFVGDLHFPTNAEYFPGIATTLENDGFRVAIIDGRSEPRVDEEYFKFALKGNACGAIMLNVIDTQAMETMLRNTKFPVVLANRYLRTVDTDIVCSDNYRGGYIATRYLIDHNHRHIAHLAGPQNSTSSYDIMRGYIDAMADSGLPIRDSDIYHGDLQADCGYAYANIIANSTDRPTAVFCTTNYAANGLIHALIERGISVPKDISVICTHDSASPNTDRVPLTCIAYDHHQLGVAAAELLLDRIKNPADQHKKLVYMPSLIERNSVITLGA